MKKGLIIISGPFNSGRSSTLSGFIELINKTRPQRILFLEQPTERLFINQKSIIEQREVGIDVVSFAAGLKSIKDEDVEVVAVDQVDNVETLELLLELAESGRLVIMAMNYDTAASVLEGIVSDFAEGKKQWAQDVLADYLVGIVVQRLLPAVQGGVALAVEILIASSSAKALIKDGRFANLESESAGISRLNQLQPLLYNISQQALFGYGFGKELTYQSSDPRILKTHPDGIYTTYAFEWGYLDIALKLGVIGLLVYLALIGMLFYLGILNLKSNILNLGLLTGLLALCVTNIFSPYLNHPLGIGYIMLISAILKNYD